MRTAQELILEFHEVFAPEQIGVFQPDRDLIALRKRLLREEWEELAEELDKAMRGRGLDDELRLKVAKEVTDILYVAYGLGVAFGMDLDGCLREVHHSNMTKLFPDGSVRRREDGKVLKGPNYQEPDLSIPAGLPTDADATRLE